MPSKFFVVPSHALVFEMRPNGKLVLASQEIRSTGVLMYSYLQDWDGYLCVRLEDETQALEWIGDLGEFYEVQARQMK